MQPSKIEQRGAVTRAWFDNCVSGQEFWFLLSSDRHHDSIHCDQRFERSHLEELKDKGGLCIDDGDMFDAMQGKFDPVQRQSPEEEELLQRKSAPGTPSVQPQGTAIETANSNGMPGPLKAGLEALSGMDLSGAILSRVYAFQRNPDKNRLRSVW